MCAAYQHVMARGDGVVVGTPLHVVVDEIGGSFVTAYGPGLNMGNSGKECEFFVVGQARQLLSISIIFLFLVLDSFFAFATTVTLQRLSIQSVASSVLP